MKRTKILMVLFLALAFFFIERTGAMAFSSNEQDCNKCHTLSSEEAKGLFKELLPDARIMEIRTSQLKGLWEVSLETRGKKGVAYIDFSKDKAVFGEIIKIKTQESLTRMRLDEINKVDFSQIPLGDALVMGDKDARNKVVIFTDPDCPYCANLHQEIKKVLEKRKDIAFFVKLFPLKMHKDAYRKAKSIQCEKSLQLLDDAFDKKVIQDPKCETNVIDNNIKLAEKLGIAGTPAIVFENGKLQSGALQAELIISLVDTKK